VHWQFQNLTKDVAVKGARSTNSSKNQLCAGMEFQIEAGNALLLLYLQVLLEAM
jgi:hypothetical protein